MSNNVWPALPGLDFHVERAKEWEWTTHQTPSGQEYRYTTRTAPRYRYKLRYNGLRTSVNAPSPWAAYTEFAIIQKFYDDHYGGFDSFLFDDPVDAVQRRVRFVPGSLNFRREAAWYSCELELISVL